MLSPPIRRRGIFILAILVVFIGGALALYAWRAPLLKQGGLFAPISREGALVFNNLFLTTACATVLVGTLYPLALQALTGDKISVGPPFFNATFGPLFIPLMAVMPFGPLMGWKRGDILGATQRLMAAALLAALAVAASFALERGGPVLAPFGVGIAIFVMAGAVTDIAERTMVLRVPFRVALRRAFGLPRSAWGTAFAHFGIGVSLLGIVAVTAWGSERIAEVKLGDSLDIAHYRITFDGLFGRAGTELSRRRRPFHRAPHERRIGRRHGAEPPHFPVAQYGDHGSGADDARREPDFIFRSATRSRTALSRCGFISSRMVLDDLARRRRSCSSAAPCRCRIGGLRVGAPRPAKAKDKPKAVLQAAE